MQKKGLFTVIVFLIVGATLIGIGLYPFGNTSQVQVLGSQTGISFVNFSFPASNHGNVTLSISGNYTLENSTTLTITNQTGTVKFNETVTSFPINVQLFNDTGEYTATFQPILTTNSTTIKVTVETISTLPPFPYLWVALFSGIPILWIGIIFFPTSVFRSLIKDVKTDKNSNKPFFRLSYATIFYGFIFAMFSFMLIYVSIVSLLLASADINPLGFLGIGISLAITLVLVSVYVLVARFLPDVDVKQNFKQLVIIRKIANVFTKAFFVTFLYLVPLYILYLYFSVNLLFSVYTFVLVIAIFFSFFSIFNTMITNEGKIIFNLLFFLQDYEGEHCSADFRSIRTASSSLSALIKPFNLEFADSSISATLSYDVLVKKDTARIRTLISDIEEHPLNHRKLLLSIESLLSDCKTLNNKGLKNKRSFFEKFKEQINLIITLISAIILPIILALLPKLLVPAS